jgi:hypothetical protein
MMNNSAPLIFLACCAALFILPLWVGIKLIGEAQRGRDSLYLMAGLFTLKPLLATPLWAVLLGFRSMPSILTVFLSLLPAVLLTTAIVVIFRPVFANKSLRSKAWLLLGLDWVRWGNTLLLSLQTPIASRAALVHAIAGLLLPTVYALVAYKIASSVIEYPVSERVNTGKSAKW